MKIWPGAAVERDKYALTPLHIACTKRQSFQSTTLLCNNWLEDKKNRTSHGLVDLEKFVYFSRSEYAKKLFTYVSIVHSGKTSDPSLNELLSFFIGIEMWNGVAFVLDKHPDYVRAMNLDIMLMGDFLSIVGRRCSLTTMWEVISNEQDLLGGA
eukprot:8773891-Ditylum_brightwellii.AAC.1